MLVVAFSNQIMRYDCVYDREEMRGCQRGEDMQSPSSRRTLSLRRFPAGVFHSSRVVRASSSNASKFFVLQGKSLEVEQSYSEKDDDREFFKRRSKIDFDK